MENWYILIDSDVRIWLVTETLENKLELICGRRPKSEAVGRDRVNTRVWVFSFIIYGDDESITTLDIAPLNVWCLVVCR